MDVYTKVLSKQDDKSVTIVSVGFLNNLSDLLKAEPDLVAPLSKGFSREGWRLKAVRTTTAVAGLLVP